MTSKPRALAPIFIVGCGRSGTTLLYDLLCFHPDLAWFSNLDDEFPRFDRIAHLSGRLPYQRGERTSLVRPSEAYRIWQYLLGANAGASNGSAVNPERARRVQHRISAHTARQGRKRFINKNTGNSRRIYDLDGMFPGAQYLHITRHPVAVTSSLIKVSWWPTLELWTHGGRTVTSLVADGWNAADLAAELWRNEVAEIQRQAPPDRTHVLSYESLAAGPVAALTEILSFCALPPTTEFWDRARWTLASVENRNTKFTKDLSPADIDGIWSKTRDVALAVGYGDPRGQPVRIRPLNPE